MWNQNRAREEKIGKNTENSEYSNINGRHPYEDIINLPHPVSATRAHMPMLDRAAQFSPFAALTGFEGAIRETARLTDQRINLDEAAKTILDEKLRIIQEQLSRQQEIEFVYFLPDERKSGGSYLTIRGVVKKLDAYEHVVIMMDGTRIPVGEIVDITGELFQAVDDFFA